MIKSRFLVEYTCDTDEESIELEESFCALNITYSYLSVPFDRRRPAVYYAEAEEHNNKVSEALLKLEKK
jgi:hypothetical protein